MKCQVQGHNEKEVLTICFDKNCENRRLCCPSCIRNFHSTHAEKLVNLNDVNAFIQKESSKQVQESLSHNIGQKQILLGLEKLNLLLDSLQKIINEKIEQIRKSNLQDILKKYQQIRNTEYQNQVIEDMLQYVQVNNSLITLIPQGQLNEIEEKQIKIVKQSEQSLQYIINQITQPQIKNDCQTQIQILQIHIGKLCFTENRKHRDIEIIGQNTIRSMNMSNYLENISLSNAMAYAKEGFDPITQSYAFAFNIQNIGRYQSGILVGLGSDERGNVPSYLFDNYKIIGHGQYMIDGSGWNYHHTDDQFNYKKNGNYFDEGDKIQIKYDHITKELEFSNSSTKKTVLTMQITDMTKILYPCAELYCIGSQVQLVDY